MENPYRIVTVSRIAPEKGQKVALEVAKMLKAMGFNFIWYFIGDGPDMQECLELVSKYELRDFCKFIGAKSNPYPYIADCDIYVSPSFVEADPITIQEALILNKPIIASGIPAIQEALDYGKLGILCSNEDPSTYVDSVVSLCKDDEKRLNLIERVHNRIPRNKIIKAKIESLLSL